jgi:uncharacterized Tic20 family protein
MSSVGTAGDSAGGFAAPGWYPDGSGAWRWWDGYAWGPVQRSRQAPSWALLAHLSLFVMMLVPAIVLRATVGAGQDRFTRHHTTEALNAQIWAALAWNVLLLPLVLTSWFSSSDDAPPTAWVLLGLPLAFALVLTTAGLAIRGALQASRGIWWRYPLPFRFVPGSVPKTQSAKTQMPT